MLVVQLRQSDLTWQIAGDEVVVLDLGGSVYLRLNGSARTLWESLAEATTEAELEQVLVDRFGIDASLARADVGSFLAELRSRNLLVE